MFQSAATPFYLQDLFLLPLHLTCNAERDASDIDVVPSAGPGMRLAQLWTPAK